MDIKSSHHKQKALFLDRDGVVNKDVGYAYKPEQIKFNKYIFQLCRKAVERNYIIVIITNQSGVARGYFTEQQVRSLHAWMIDKFKEHGIGIAKVYYCPFLKDGAVSEYAKESDCRKPAPGMILQAERDFNIDLSRSFFIGDKPSDRIKLPGFKSFIVRSQYTKDGFDLENLKDVIELL